MWEEKGGLELCGEIVECRVGVQSSKSQSDGPDGDWSPYSMLRKYEADLVDV